MPAAITKVYLLNVPLENDYKNTLYFSSAAAQQTYFASKVVKSYTDFTYQRKDKIIRIPDIVDNLYTCNYVMYQNSAYGNKWFYAFIDKMEYINDGRTDVTIETDVMQTWAFDYTVKASFVEREHVDNDTIGLHTVPEALETGDYICNDISTVDLGLLWYVVGCTKTYGGSEKANYSRGGGIYNGIYSGKTYYALRTTGDLENFIEDYDQAGFGEDIAELFTVPAKLIGNPTYDSGNPVYRVPNSVGITQLATNTLSRPGSLNGYTPKNNKLLVFPYQYLSVDNNAGNSAEFYYELFSNPASCRFEAIGALTPGTSMSVLPIAYTNAGGNGTITEPNMFNLGLSLGKYPACNWNTDVYINWLTQNGVNMQMNTFNGIVNGVTSGAASGSSAGVGGAAAGAALGGIKGGLDAVLNNVVQKYNHSFSPTQAKGNANAGDVITSGYANKPFFYKMSIRAEYAQIIDNYFDLFGYKVNRVKVPNTAHRAQWWYTKTIDVNIDGAIPNDDMQKIKNAFNFGITFWRNPANIQNYSLANGIV